MTEFPYAIENRVVKGEPIIALFRTREEADEYVRDSIDLRVISNRDDWTVAMLHLPDCPRCEECVNLAVDSARATGSSGGSWQMIEPMPDGTHSIMHRAVVERKA